MPEAFDLHRELNLAAAQQDLVRIQRQASQQRAHERRLAEEVQIRTRIERIEWHLKHRAGLSEARRCGLNIRWWHLMMEIGAVAEGSADREISRLYRQALAARRATR